MIETMWDYFDKEEEAYWGFKGGEGTCLQILCHEKSKVGFCDNVSQILALIDDLKF